MVAGDTMVGLMVAGKGAIVTCKGDDTGLVELFLVLVMEVLVKAMED